MAALLIAVAGLFVSCTTVKHDRVCHLYSMDVRRVQGQAEAYRLTGFIDRGRTGGRRYVQIPEVIAVLGRGPVSRSEEWVFATETGAPKEIVTRTLSVTRHSSDYPEVAVADYEVAMVTRENHTNTVKGTCILEEPDH